MKIYNSEHTFEHPWDTVVQAAWRKYPNPLNPNVIGLDVLDRKVDKLGILHSNRLMATQWALPSWVNTFLGVSNPVIHVNECSEVNPKKKLMTLKSTNITLGTFITIDEKLEYMQHPEKPQCTLLRQEAVIGVKHIPMSSYLEGLVTGTCSSNALKGRQSMEWVIETIKEETQALTKQAEQQMQCLSKSAEEQISCLSKSAEEQMQNISKISGEQIDTFKNYFYQATNL